MIGVIPASFTIRSLQDSLQRQLSDLRSKLAHSRTAPDVLGALGLALVPRWAGGLQVIVRDSPQPVTRLGSLDGIRAVPIPPELFDHAKGGRVWLCTAPAHAAEKESWTPIDPIAEAAEICPAKWIAISFEGFGKPAVVVVDVPRDRTEWTESELSIVHECVRLVEFALRSIQQHQGTQEARAAADAAAHRWSALARMSSQLIRAVDFEDVATSIVNSVVPYLADWALLDIVLPSGKVERIRHCHSMPGAERLLATVGSFPFGPAAPADSIARLDEAGWLIPQVLPQDIMRLAGADEHAAVEELAPKSVAVVPLVVGEQIRGVLTLVTTTPGQQYKPEDLLLFNSLADQAALALNSAQLYGDAKRARMEREEVLAIVSHDLKNPLNTLGFSLSILTQAGIAETAKAQQYGVMERALEQMNSLVRDLLDTARIDAGRFSVTPSTQDAAALVLEALLQSAPLAEQSRVHLEHTDLQAAPVLADRHRIMQVFSNLIDNAISFTPAGGKIHLRIAVRDAMVDFEVADSGPGLDAETAEHVFDRFWQARHSGRAGAGLGLAIARGIVEAHGGEIGVRSRAGHGAVFHFSLPRAPGAPA